MASDDAAFLSSLVEPAWKQRARRLALRDDAIRTALAMLAGEASPPARLAAQMAMQGRERWAGRMTGNHMLVATVATILDLNDGATMTERHLRNIAAGDRTPRK